MEPVVSPWIFYTMNVLLNLKSLVDIILFSFALVLGSALFVLLIDDGTLTGDREKIWKVIQPYFKICFIIFVVCGLLWVFIPSKETMLQMLVASMVTPDNIHAVQENTVQFVQAIAQAVEDIVNK